MTLLSVAVALVAVLCLLDLVLTLGVVRRLRDHSSRLSLMQSGLGAEETLGKPGEAVEPFTALSAADEPVSLTDLAEPTLVGFFSPNCPACEERLPGFVSYASTFPGGRRKTLAIIAGETGGLRYRSALDEVAANVVIERELGPVQKAFGTSGYPAFYVVVDGVIAQAAHNVDDLPAPQPA